MISEASQRRLEESERAQAQSSGNRIPPSGVEVAVASSDYREVPCRDCGKLIVWMKTKNGKNMPVNAETVKFGEILLFDQSKGHVSHFSDCPAAEKFRKPR
jgi:hypothetical protein